MSYKPTREDLRDLSEHCRGNCEYNKSNPIGQGIRVCSKYPTLSFDDRVSICLKSLREGEKINKIFETQMNFPISTFKPKIFLNYRGTPLKNKFKRTFAWEGSACDILKQHSNFLKEDPDRLSSDFMKKIIFGTKDACIDDPNNLTKRPGENTKRSL